ncbi:Hypothetical predicted protein [Podarcis lilfordi]|nr:Hypothetical predicted protein [Podarcis lilfordi]
MSPKRVPAQPALTVPPKRTIRGPSQSLRSPSTGHASGGLQSLVSSLAVCPRRCTSGSSIRVF